MSRHALQWGAESLWHALTPLLPNLSLEVVAHCNSTNTALLERARARAEAGNDAVVQVRRSVESSAFGRRAADVQPCLLVAEHQTHGRGRMGRAWEAAPGASLTFSLSLPMSPADWSGLSLAVGVALADALDPAPRPGAPGIGLKWPNDLWLTDPPSAGQAVIGRKLGGILIETVIAGSVRLAVVGVGLNIAPRDEHTVEMNTGYACLQELQPQASAPRALAQLAVPLVQALQTFEREGFAPFAARYAARDLLRGRGITTTQTAVPSGVAEGVTTSGTLKVRAPDQQVHEVSSGEVSVRLSNDHPTPC